MQRCSFTINNFGGSEERQFCSSTVQTQVFYGRTAERKLLKCNAIGDVKTAPIHSTTTFFMLELQNGGSLETKKKLMLTPQHYTQRKLFLCQNCRTDALQKRYNCACCRGTNKYKLYKTYVATLQNLNSNFANVKQQLCKRVALVELTHSNFAKLKQQLCKNLNGNFANN